MGTAAGINVADDEEEAVDGGVRVCEDLVEDFFPNFPASLAAKMSAALWVCLEESLSRWSPGLSFDWIFLRVRPPELSIVTEDG